RQRGGEQISRLDRPQPLLEAEARIAYQLRQHPGNATALSNSGRANLLEQAYEAAITDLQQALDSRPRSPELLDDLGSALFERAEMEARFADYGTAFELQSRALAAKPNDLVALFNRAITADRLFLYKQSIHDWQAY